MRQWVRRVLPALVRWLMRWAWSSPPVESSLPVLIEAAPEPTEVVPRPRRRHPKLTDALAIWSFRSVILERLDDYFILIRRMRRFDPEAYGYFSRVGFSIPATYARGDEQTYAKLATIPARTFGGVMLGGKPVRKGFVHPSFLYFHKIKHPVKVQAVGGGDIYRLTCLFDDRTLATVCSCHVVVNGTTVTLLKEELGFRQRISPPRSKRGHAKPAPFDMVYTHWDVPSWVHTVAEDHDTTAAAWVQSMFALTAVTHHEANRQIVIRVKHDQDTASFGIHLATAKRFFRDRDKTSALARDGKRKRIFHAVRAHDRHLTHLSQGERIVDVKAHYRGLRTFFWQQYRVHIVWPTNTNVLEFKAAATYREDLSAEERRTFLTEATVGKIIAGRLDE